MSTHHWHYVDETSRRKWQDPEAVLAEIGLQPGMKFIDIGCGQGFFSLPAARLVGPQGTVYGLDIDASAIDELQRRALSEGLHNLQLTVGPAEDTVLCQACGDVLFFGIALHDFQDQARVLASARKMLKLSGKLVNLDFKKEDTGFGPPVAKRFDEATASQMIEKAGFKASRIKYIGQDFYLIFADPK